MHSLSFLLTLQTTHEQVYHSACLFAPSPQHAKLVVFTIKLRVHIAFFEVKHWQAIFFASTFSLELFEIIYFWDKDLLPPTDCYAALANNAGQIALGVKFALRLRKLVGPNLLPTSGHSFRRSLLSLWSNSDLPISRLCLPHCFAAST